LKQPLILQERRHNSEGTRGAMAKALRGTQLNFSDIPEMLPGARPGANRAQREEFEKRSRMLHHEDVEELTQQVTFKHQVAGVGTTSTEELEAMFPMLDAALVRSIHADSPSAQHALDTLLALTACSVEPVGGAAAGKPPAQTNKLPKWEVGLEDHNKFPSLLDADGWQCVSGSKLLEGEKDPGSAWLDSANAAKDKPAPKAKAEAVVWGTKKKQARQRAEAEQAQPWTDYECRHRAGERRAKQRVQYSRGHGSGLSGRGRGRGAGGDVVSGSAESEEEFDISDV